MPLIEQRHPVFAQLMALWRLQSTDASPPLASAIVPALVEGLARATVLLGGDIDEALTIRVSGRRRAGGAHRDRDGPAPVD